jgi:formyl-CoA transferase
VEQSVLGKMEVLGVGVNLSRTPPGIRSAAPEAGEHTEEILRELGYSPAEVEELRAAGDI